MCPKHKDSPLKSCAIFLKAPGGIDGATLRLSFAFSLAFVGSLFTVLLSIRLEPPLLTLRAPRDLQPVKGTGERKRHHSSKGCEPSAVDKMRKQGAYISIFAT